MNAIGSTDVKGETEEIENMIKHLRRSAPIRHKRLYRDKIVARISPFTREDER